MWVKLRLAYIFAFKDFLNQLLFQTFLYGLCNIDTQTILQFGTYFKISYHLQARQVKEVQKNQIINIDMGYSSTILGRNMLRKIVTIRLYYNYGLKRINNDTIAITEFNKPSLISD